MAHKDIRYILLIYCLLHFIIFGICRKKALGFIVKGAKRKFSDAAPWVKTKFYLYSQFIFL
ncbi:MAG: hypothetical protein CFE24_06055 [Flavobacterium sp. BFFFF2]|nr:MAG: hypothetical protein CFE24_06055 [Flavobacterium sp. BFFFF2]